MSNANTGHGHVRPRPDGVKARCGGPGMCSECGREKAQAGHDATKVYSPPKSHIWIQTWSPADYPGGCLDLVNPKPDQIDFETIATVLARVPRFGGHTTRGVLSVAQHCEQGARALQRAGHPEAAAAFLIHDAHEAFMGDIATPVAAALAAHAYAACGGDRLDRKLAARAVRDGVTRMKFTLDTAIHVAAGIAWPLPEPVAALVKEYDVRMLYTERAERMAPPPYPWRTIAEPVAGADCYPWSEGTVAALYLAACKEMLPALIVDSVRN